MYQPRFYRFWTEDKDLISFNVAVGETDLFICARKNLSRKTHKLVLKYRCMLESYINSNPTFLKTLKPCKFDKNAPEIVREMVRAANKVGVGPMAAVAGAVSEFVGHDLLKHTPEIIIENGGDIFLKLLKERKVGIYAGNSVFSGKIAIEVTPEETPLGICTSSGTVGHSISFGKADAAVVLARSAPLADACATAVCNLIQEKSDLARGIKFVRKIKGVIGGIIIIKDRMSVWGKVKLV